MKIKDVERLTNISAATVRYWEERGLLHADRTANKYREYNELDLNLICQIKSFREIGISIADIKLWRDGVVDSRSLLIGHRKHIDETDNENKRILELCNSMLAGIGNVGNSDKPFTENEILPDCDLILGVDIGTTSIAAQLISIESGEPIHTYSIDHEAAMANDIDPDAFAADAEKLCSITTGLIQSAIGAYPRIVSIGISGQMHGIVCLGEKGELLSPLYTWQNQFGLRKIGDETVCEKIKRLCGKAYPTGYGLVTYYALRELGLLPDKTVKLTCIADLAAMKLCSLDSPISHPTNAASFGFFDVTKNEFDLSALKALDIPQAILPKVSDDMKICGNFREIPVAVAVGDNQAGAFGSIRGDEILLNIGTSAQVSFVGNYEACGKLSKNQAYEIRPYFGGRYLHTGAILCGGRSLAMLAELLAEIARGFGVSPAKKQIYDLINSSAMLSNGELDISTKFSGTRTNPASLGSIERIGVNNFTLPEIADGFCRGIINELYELYNEMSEEAPRGMAVSGNALRRSPALRDSAEKIFGCKAMILCHIEEAAYGAALFSAVCAGKLTIESSRKLIKLIE